MPAKRYIVSLTEEERQELEKLTKTGKAAARKINHARILLKADINQSGGGWKDSEIASALDVSIRTIERVRQRWMEEGLEKAINPRPHPESKLKKIDGEKEIAAWEKQRNQTGSVMDWQFTTEEARIKLKHLYPLIKH
ncbi:helix-turn-helix domain-containing protein [Roseofilum sp. BLCC_M143]|uniref:Helix-turn-helix domain-containing protein n=6 Tax=Roseofilum casamattae BLCC-M143 TaxID=3022442 RepID=A0ABT7BSA3_9CYAN|nr:helix-turn-helix domain-containing protein [Roseofilum casamattae]MDJ1182067.1 helix-turn-helix domain-containing protein [Roseofilum casamattae BLCC-M143]